MIVYIETSIAIQLSCDRWRRLYRHPCSRPLDRHPCADGLEEAGRGVSRQSSASRAPLLFLASVMSVVTALACRACPDDASCDGNEMTYIMLLPVNTAALALVLAAIICVGDLRHRA